MSDNCVELSPPLHQQTAITSNTSHLHAAHTHFTVQSVCVAVYALPVINELTASLSHSTNESCYQALCTPYI